ncbi:MAG: hypothetical protein ABEJ72_08720, partial [Candidatus Aenigmatarchaeota archaeon]
MGNERKLATYNLSEEEFRNRDINELCEIVSVVTTLEELESSYDELEYIAEQSSSELDEMSLV